MANPYEDCATCGAPEQKTMLNHEGNCVPCEQVLAADDGEIPVEVVMKLLAMAKSRHPKTCNEDAPNFEQVLVEQGMI